MRKSFDEWWEDNKLILSEMNHYQAAREVWCSAILNYKNSPPFPETLQECLDIIYKPQDTSIGNNQTGWAVKYLKTGQWSPADSSGDKP